MGIGETKKGLLESFQLIIISTQIAEWLVGTYLNMSSEVYTAGWVIGSSTHFLVSVLTLVMHVCRISF